ncbi:MAG: hypothetical protein JSS81_08505 [Acidobacteria bacterium]|nr:hypothetical protein [Acidobacteriota bacterium]
MENIFENRGPRAAGAWQAIVFGGLVAGALDITAASVNAWLRAGKSPFWTFQSVAGGLYGSETFNGGWRTAALGLIIHFLIATTAAAVFFLASRRLKFMTEKPFLSGPLYGVAVYVFMYFGVLPLTPLNITYTLTGVLTAVVIHIFCVGLPIALVVRRFAP